MNDINSGKVIIPLMGGLGNQIFQLAFACRLQSAGVIVVPSATVLNSKLIHSLLGWVKHPDTQVQDFYTYLGFKDYSLGLLDFAYLVKILGLRKTSGAKFFDIGYLDLIDLLSSREARSMVVPGYFQTVDHVDINSLQFVSRQLLIFYQKKMDVQHLETKPVAVHIRRKEFPPSGLLNEKYYMRILSKYDPSDVVFVTNDPEYVSKVYFGYIKDGASLSNGRDLFEDFYTLAKARTLVLSSSTFSYSAACAGTASIIHYPDRFSSTLGYKFPVGDNFLKESAIFDSEV